MEWFKTKEKLPSYEGTFLGYFSKIFNLCSGIIEVDFTAEIGWSRCELGSRDICVKYWDEYPNNPKYIR